TTSPVLVPQLLEGMQALKSGRAPSRGELAAIGRALEIAKRNPDTEKELQSLFEQTRDDSGPQPEEDPYRDERTDQYSSSSGFEMSALQWAFDEASARVSSKDLGKNDAPKGASGAEKNSSDEEKPGEPTANGDMTNAKIKADVRGQAASFSLLLFGHQAASGQSDRAAGEAAAQKKAAIAAVLRGDVVHARTDLVNAPNVEAAKTRRASNAEPDSGTLVVAPAGITYDAVKASQPPAVPEARRALVHDFFLRAADTGATSPPPVRPPG
ncbi:MAG: hypothetical protein ABI652_01390, partial [Acidobacteriota bacterium]